MFHSYSYLDEGNMLDYGSRGTNSPIYLDTLNHILNLGSRVDRMASFIHLSSPWGRNSGGVREDILLGGYLTGKIFYWEDISLGRYFTGRISQ